MTTATAPTLNVQFTRKQEAAIDLLTSAPRSLLYGGSSSGKTFLIVAFLVESSMMYPGLRSLILRQHRQHAKESVWNETLMSEVLPYYPGALYQINHGDLHVRFWNGSEIWVSGTDDRQRIEKALGRGIGLAYLNEASQISYEAWSIIRTRLRQKIPHWQPRIVVDCNPPPPQHWIHRIFIELQEPTDGTELDPHKYGALQMNPGDNIENLPDGYIDELNELPEHERRRFLLGEFVQIKGAIYEEFDKSVHVNPLDPPDSWDRYSAVDFGYTNPFVCLWGALDEDDRLYIYDEHYKTKELISYHASEIKRRGEVLVRVADHDAQDVAELRQAGIDTTPATKDVLPGIRAVKGRLQVQGDGRPRLYIHPRCVNLLWEISMYVWDDSPGANAKERPRKENDHAMDALRYLCMALDSSRVPKVWRF